MTDRERLIELLKRADQNASDKLIMDYDDATDDIADFLLANGVKVPVCNINDLVYVIRRKRKRANGGYYNSICSTQRNMHEAIKKGEAYVDCKKATKTDINLIGATVFLTREEAERALEGAKSYGKVDKRE